MGCEMSLLRRNVLKLTKGLTITATTILIIAAAAAATFNEPSRHADAATSPATIDAQQLCQRTEHVRIAILQAIPGADATCTDADPPMPANYETNATAQQLAGITELNLITRYPEIPLIREFKDGDFQGLTGLTAIYLVEQPQITKDGLAAAGIPISVLARLETLIFVNSDISAIESADYFRGMSNLRTLSVTTNNMTYELPGNPNRPEGTKVGRLINPEAWKHLPNLRKLAIGSNRILTLPPEFFKHLSKLEELDMYDMWYEYHPYGFGSQALPADVFKGLTKLRKLDIGYNALGATEIDDGLFNGLTSLEVLNLRDNPLLETLPRSVLDLPEGVTILTDPGVKYPSDGENQPATGSPTVSGEARVGETLTASVDAVQDGDGSDNAQFAYQWVRNGGTNDADIGGATGETYELSNDDVGKTIKVRVSFTDDAGNEESLTSAATAAVAAKPNPLTGFTVVDVSDQTVLGTLADGGTLKLDDPANGSYSIQVNTEPGVEIGSVRLQLTGGKSVDQTEGIAPYSLYGDDGSALNGQSLPTGSYTLRATAYSEADLGGDVLGTLEVSFTVAATNTPATGAPTISGTAQVGEMLTAETSAIEDADGLSDVAYNYQWLAADTEIAGATSSNYTLVDADEGKTIRVKVSFTDDAENQESLTSEATETVGVLESHDRPYNLRATVAEGAITLTWQDPDTHRSHGLYHILRHRPELGEDKSLVYVEYTPSTDRTFTDSAVEPGVLYVYAVKAVKDYFGFLGPASDSVEVRMPPGEGGEAPNSPATGVPTISGTAQVGETLTVDTSGISDPDGLESARFTYNWFASDNSEIGFVLGAGIHPTYVVQSSSEGMNIGVSVVYTDDAGNTEGPRSEYTAAVTAAANPRVPEAPKHRRVDPPLSVSPQGSGELEVTWFLPGYPYGDGGSAITSRKVQWKEASGSWDNDADVSEEVVLGHCWVCRYTITGLTNGVAYTVRVFVTNAIGDSPPSDELISTPTDGTALTLSGISRANYPEDERLGVATYTVTGAQAAITWSLSGDDGDEFSINTAGDLRFKSLPSFENPTDADRDNQYRVTVQASDGTNTATLQVVVVVNSRGRPIINGNAQVGQTLTADTSGITDADGLYNPNFTYQWIANDGNTDSEIAGATAYTYTLTDSEEGKTIKVRASFTDYPGNEESLTSVATDEVEARPNSPATGQPTITGTAQVGETLTASTSGIEDADGLSNVAYNHQWLAADAEIAGATSSSYTLADADEGKTIRVKVSFTDDAENQESLTSEATEAVQPKANSPATGQPTISGTAQVGETLTASTSGIEDADGLSNVAYSYQWLAADAEIQDATDSTYVPDADNEGQTIKVRVSFTDDAGNEETLTSAATRRVAARPNTAVTGAPRNLKVTAGDGGELKVSWEGPASDSGSTITGYKVQWKSGAEEYDGTAASTRQAAVTGMASLSYIITGLTNDVAHTVRVIAINSQGDGAPSAGVTGTPLSKNAQLHAWIEKDIVEKHEGDHPWLRTTWEYMNEPGFELVAIIHNKYAGRVFVRHFVSSEHGLEGTKAYRMEVEIRYLPHSKGLMPEQVAIHEMAHVYTLTNDLSATPAPLGIAHVYFERMEGIVSSCVSREIYASMTTIDVLGPISTSYWRKCRGTNDDGNIDSLTQEALSVVGSALSGRMPQWFADTYNDSEGNTDLETLWADVKATGDNYRPTVVYRLRNAFGGYCDNEKNSPICP